ncbi:MAG: RHS repeat-associated core domain-containing protein, partial [Myxococcota bacterium]
MVTETQGGASSEEGDGKTEYTFVYDGFGRLYQESVDERLVRTILYDVDDNVVSIDIPDGGVTTLAPDSFNAPLQVTGPDGTVEITQQDAVGRVVREEVLSPEGASVLLRSYTYDDLDRPLSITDTVIDGDDQRPVLYEYAYSADRLTTTLNIRAGGETRTSSVTRDLAGRVASSTDAEGTTTRLTYTGPDLTGIEVIRAGEDNRVTRQSLVPDQGGRTTSLTLTGASVDDPEAASRTITYRYDTRDNVLEETVSGGVSVVRTYDAFDRLRSESLGEQQTTYTYDDRDNLIELTNANKSMLTQYDARNRPTITTYADGSTLEREYNRDNTVRELKDRAGNTFIYGYDTARRVNSISVDVGVAGFDPSTVGRAFSYDALGRVISAESAGSFTTSVKRRFNTIGTVLSEENSGSLGLSFLTVVPNAFGERESVTYNDGWGEALNLLRDKRGNISKVTGSRVSAEFLYSGPDFLERVKYDSPFGLEMESVRTPNAVGEEGSRRLQRLNGLIEIDATTIGRTSDGRIESLARPGRTDSFVYTPGERWLEQVVLDSGGTNETTVVYEYDTSANRVSETRDGQTVVYSPNALNQYEDIGDDTLVYDLNGNLQSRGAGGVGAGVSAATSSFGVSGRGTGVRSAREPQAFALSDDSGVAGAPLNTSVSAGGLSYSFDAFNQLTEVHRDGGLVAQYRYDGLGRLRRREYLTGTTPRAEELLYDGAQLVAIRDLSDGTIRKRFIYKPDSVDQPVAAIIDGVVYYYELDARGNVVAFVNASDGEAQRFFYDDGGRPMLESGPLATRFSTKNELFFKGRPYDFETDLYNMRARWYSPELGRFISSDPLGPVDGPNTYSFALNDPINLSDPSGEIAIS